MEKKRTLLRSLMTAESRLMSPSPRAPFQSLERRYETGSVRKAVKLQG